MDGGLRPLPRSRPHGPGEVEAGVAEVLEWGALFRQTGCSGAREASFTDMMSEAMHIAGRSEEALVENKEGERRAKAGYVLAMMPEITAFAGTFCVTSTDWIKRTKPTVKPEIAPAPRARVAPTPRIDIAVGLAARARATGGHLDGTASGERRGTKLCAPDRPDWVAARELLTRLWGEAAPTSRACRGPSGAITLSRLGREADNVPAGRASAVGLRFGSRATVRECGGKARLPGPPAVLPEGFVALTSRWRFLLRARGTP